ncbi:MAG: hypothetical protein ABI690_25065 [Chloroflexota bacterium]
MMTQPTPHPIRNHIAAYGFFLALAILITWPLLTVLSTSFAGYPFGDAHEMTRHIWWFKYALQHGQPLIFQPLLGYPDGIPGVILWSDPLQFFPGWLFAFIMPLPAAYNVQCLLNLALNGWAAYFLMWKLTDHQRFPALLAGVVFMTAPVMQGHLAGGHGGLLVQWPLPLLAWALLNLRTPVGARHVVPTPEDNPKRISRFRLSTRYLALSTLFFVLLPFGHTLQLIYAAMPLIGVFGLTLLVKRDWWALLRLIVIVTLGSIILLIFLIPVFQSTLGTSAYTDEGGGVAFSMDLLGVVTPSFNHPLFGQLDYTHRVLGVNIVEGSSYIGIIAGLLVLLALWKNRAARWWLLLAVVAWVLALGPLLKIFDTPISIQNGEYSTFITLPWSLVANLPGFNLARTPGRFGFVMALAVAVMAGYGAESFQSLVASFQSPDQNNPSATHRWARTRYISSLQVLLVVITALILLDYQSFWPLPTYSAEIPQAVHDLAGRNDVRAVFDVPWENVLAAKDALWLQTAHEKPMIAGQVTRKTPVSPAKLTILEQTFDPALLKDAGVDVVIVHKQYDTDGKLAENSRAKLGDPFYEDEQLVLFNVPEIKSQPEIWIASAPWIPAIHPEDLQFMMPSETPLLGDSANSFVYLPESGWLSYRLAWIKPVQADAILYLDDKPIREVTSSGGLGLWLPISEPGYHSIRLRLQPACPLTFDVALSCGFPWPGDFIISDFVSNSFTQPAATFDRGINLRGIHIDAQYGIMANIALWWQFNSVVTDQDIRFVKVLDSEGKQIDGVDETLGNHKANSEWIETVSFTKKSNPGTYRICVGWYSYPDLTRFAVLSDVDGAQDGLACIGQFTVPGS